MPSTKLTLQNLPKTFNFSPKCRNFAKSGRTGRHRVSLNGEITSIKTHQNTLALLIFKISNVCEFCNRSNDVQFVRQIPLYNFVQANLSLYLSGLKAASNTVNRQQARPLIRQIKCLLTCQTF